MPVETMTPLERWQAVLARKLPDRVPLDYRATPEAHRQLKAFLGIADDRDLYARLHVDCALGVAGRYVGPQLPAHTDAFGCRYRDVTYGDGTYSEVIDYPLGKYHTLDEIKQDYRWPQPDWWEYSHLAASLRGWEQYPVNGGGAEVFLIYHNLRGREQAFIDLVDNPEMVHYCLEHLFELAYQNTLRIYEALPGRVTFSFIAEDLGSQEGLMYSPAQISEFLLPGMRRMIALAHQAGVSAFHHNDGAIRKILPAIIGSGIDALDPVQWRCQGMDREGLKRDFGKQLVFHGGVDNQYTMVFGTPADVRQEVADNIRILGAGGGYILGPCHNIQVVSPPENIVALYDAGFEHGWY